MKFPSFLNPFRKTAFAWLFPFTWEVIKAAATAAPITLEVFLHHRFGVRTGKALLKGLILVLVFFALVSRADPPVSVPLFPGYVFGYMLAAFGQWLSARNRRDERI